MAEPAVRSAVLLDAHPLWLDALVRVVQGEGVRVVALTSSAAGALAALEGRQPDLFVLDPALPGGEAEGLACLRAACAQSPALKAVVVSASEEPAAIQEAFAAGASVYARKRASGDDLAAAVRQAFAASIFLPPPLGWASLAKAAASAVAASGLTRRERQILGLVAEGWTNAQVAGKLWLSEQTVKFHLGNVYRKLGVANRTEASRWAHENGLLAETAALAAPAPVTAAVEEIASLTAAGTSDPFRE